MTQYQFSQHEFVEKTGFIPEKKYRKRQDYLKAALVHVTRMPEDAWQQLPEAIYEWSKAAAKVNIHNKEHPDNQQLIPDFNEDEHNAEAASDHSGQEVDDNSDTSVTEGGEVVEGQEASTEDTGGVGQTDQTPAKAPKKQRATKKVKAAKPKKEKGPARGLNPWGVQIGTKSHDACMMAARPEGTTQKEISEALGQTHYNLFNRIERKLGQGAVKYDEASHRIWLVPRQ